MASGADWLPLTILPLVCLLLLLYAGDFVIKYYRKWRLYKENKLIRDLLSGGRVISSVNEH